MLKKIARKKLEGGGGRFAIVASEYNGKYVNAMLRAARRTLADAGAGEVRTIRVPGAFEIPVVAGALSRQEPRWSAIICLGVIFRGETTHAQHIGEVVSHLLGRMAAESGVPMIHEVLLLENEGQAVKRCLDPSHNRGTEAAQAALAMRRVMAGL